MYGAAALPAAFLAAGMVRGAHLPHLFAVSIIIATASHFNRMRGGCVALFGEAKLTLGAPWHREKGGVLGEKMFWVRREDCYQ